MRSRQRKMIVGGLLVVVALIGAGWALQQPTTAALMGGWWDGPSMACNRWGARGQVQFQPNQRYEQLIQDTGCFGSYTLTRDGIHTVLVIEGAGPTVRYQATLFAGTLTLTTETGHVQRYTRIDVLPCEVMCNP